MSRPVQLPPYTRGDMPEDTLLRDRLAAQRTMLANERTLLAYLRTAIAFAAAGASAVHFLDSTFLDVLGWVLVAASVVAVVVGAVRFGKVRALVNRQEAELTGR
jgi:putative membrane protein